MSEKYPVLEGAEPFYFEGNEIGILVSHGFTGSTQSMRPLGDAYANAGYTVCGPRLRGHGTHYKEMETTTYQDWIHSVEEGYQWLKERCSTIFVTGLSMGGTLTLYMAEKYPEIKGIIPINAAIEIPDMAAAASLKDVRFLDAIGSDIKNPDIKELAYEKTPVKSLGEITELMKKVKADLDKVTCPALIFVSKEDHVVPPSNSQEIYSGIKSAAKELVTLDNSYHVATLDNDQDIIIERTLHFLRRTLETSSLQG
ncbi:alpha/beta fold hydrolase [Cytobacillus firmus]|uniref:alpha/beta hydrolase n=1 Tax=Cytobacillus firmus TaxID=1399 RepID=UPI0018CDA4B9|nr:alpha/beta fold hydrolase [Cytobacillus firmus]MBG9547823.1 monoacylglycerol lipase [Cytobacillus firmus]MBG9603432.1 monoacylglycerol lipase [Cytobacillus firmus]MBG9654648.1 monoacylglycerol lipase [Cytobacillus firmus]MDD9314089.1 alpha/beta fold hydrolase [Cytobacillus firmus]MED1905539.1 alpha/beta fold hydrolase [Cytobacillus firmus]